jgi:hypothetical protein
MYALMCYQNLLLTEWNTTLIIGISSFLTCAGWSSFKELWKMRGINMKNPSRKKNGFEAQYNEMLNQ